MPQLLNRQEVCLMLDISESTLSRYCNSREKYNFPEPAKLAHNGTRRRLYWQKVSIENWQKNKVKKA
jgi:predicted DNA-binding transcriptional regulator AlpA